MKKKFDISKVEIREWLTTDSDPPPTTNEINQTEDTLLNFASEHSLKPPSSLRDKILDKMSTLNKQKETRQNLDVNKLPILDESSNWLDWEAVINGIETPNDYENVHLHSLESSDKRELYVAWVKEYVEEEVHHDLLESFLILEGSCVCHIKDKAGRNRIVHMNQGDFITMQIGETHKIYITSPEPTKAILQWLKQAG
jgi:mannose-6-phosphate isomerase-like protein (cupin superfamily)